MTKPTDAEIISRGLDLLRASILASALPGELMREFGITRERARRLAGEALRRCQAQKRPATDHAADS